MSDRSVSRRDFLMRLGVAGAAGAVLTSCRTDDRAATAPGAQGQAATGDQIVAAECPGYDQISEDQLSVRRTLNYQDVTPQAGQYCHNCRFLVDAPQYDPCIGCQLFEGPVAPEGWCSSWAAMT